MAVKVKRVKEIYAICRKVLPLTDSEKQRLYRAYEKYLKTISEKEPLTDVDKRRIHMIKRRLAKADYNFDGGISYEKFQERKKTEYA